MIYSFKNDYNTIACKEVMENLLKFHDEQNIGYGEDYHTKNACNIIKEKINNNNVEVILLIGGTSTNTILISHALRNYEACICVNTGHINVHETGSVEATGHKLLQCNGKDGKLFKEDIINILKAHTDHHMVKPKMVYISNTTEIGSIYTKKELIELYNCCKENDLYLFLDGARLASALTSIDNDLTLEDICNYTDAFYIGATKNGGLLGEALVIKNEELKNNIKYSVKNKTGLLAKGYVTGIIFETLFEDDLYFKFGDNANKAALILKEGFLQLGFKLLYPNNTNQIFVYLENDLIERIKEDYLFEVQEKLENISICRFCTSYNTDILECKAFIEYLTNIVK